MLRAGSTHLGPAPVRSFLAVARRCCDGSIMSTCVQAASAVSAPQAGQLMMAFIIPLEAITCYQHVPLHRCATASPARCDPRHCRSPRPPAAWSPRPHP